MTEGRRDEREALIAKTFKSLGHDHVVPLIDALIQSDDEEILVENPPQSWQWLVYQKIVEALPEQRYTAGPLLHAVIDHFNEGGSASRIVPDVDLWFSDLQHRTAAYEESVEMGDELHARAQLRVIRRSVQDLVAPLSRALQGIERTLLLSDERFYTIERKIENNRYLLSSVAAIIERINRLSYSRLRSVSENMNIRRLTGDLSSRLEGVVAKLQGFSDEISSQILVQRQHLNARQRKLRALLQYLRDGGSLPDADDDASLCQAWGGSGKEFWPPVVSTSEAEENAYASIIGGLPCPVDTQQQTGLDESDEDGGVVYGEVSGNLSESQCVAESFHAYKRDFLRIALTQEASLRDFWIDRADLRDDTSYDVWLLLMSSYLRSLATEGSLQGRLSLNECIRDHPPFMGSVVLEDIRARVLPSAGLSREPPMDTATIG